MSRFFPIQYFLFGKNIYFLHAFNCKGLCAKIRAFVFSKRKSEVDSWLVVALVACRIGSGCRVDNYLQGSKICLL